MTPLSAKQILLDSPFKLFKAHCAATINAKNTSFHAKNLLAQRKQVHHLKIKKVKAHVTIDGQS
jgi:hypothetical protein